MKILTILTAAVAILQTFRVTIFYLRKDIKNLRKVFETLLLVIMIILCYFDLEEIKLSIYISLLPCLYIIGMFIYERLFDTEYISVLSVKKALDMSDSGIMFLDKEEVVLINNTMKNILNDLNIHNDYIDNLIKMSFRKINDNYILKVLNKIWSIIITDKKEVILLDITDIYSLQEEKELQNKMIEENNMKILETIQSIEKIDKTKNLLKIKNEYHDLLGHRLALFTKYFEQDKINTNDIEFLLDSITKDFDDKKALNILNIDTDNLKINNYSDTSDIKGIEIKNIMRSKLQCQRLAKCNSNIWETFITLTFQKNVININVIIICHIIGVNINLLGNLPNNEKIASIFFEIIREAVTNAIIHADSKNIDIIIKIYLDKIEMVITNDGKKNTGIIYENEGIKGMRRKLSEIGGNLTIVNDDIFTLKIIL